MLLTLFFAFFIASLSLYIFYPLAIKVGFVDCPSARKLHQGNIPLIGGISIFLPVAILLQIYPDLIAHSQTFVCCSAFFLIIGLIDDKFDLSVKLRISLIVAISIWLVTYADIKIHDLGDLMGFGNISLNHIEILFNAIAIVGAVTAFNMVDGLDGLLGGLAIVTLSSLGLLFAIKEQYDLLLFCGIIIASIIPYVCCNLDLLPKKKMKIFMGDSGSLFIGFVIFWLLIEGSQNHHINNPLNVVHPLHPVTVLWIIAIPLMDMTYTMIRRIRKKQSPFKADREHIHHVCDRLGLSSLQTLLLICTLASLFSIIGLIGEIFHVSEMIMFISFIMVFIGYYLCFTHIWKVTVVLRHFTRRFK